MKWLLLAIPIFLILGCEKSTPVSLDDEYVEPMYAITYSRLDTTRSTDGYSWVLRWTVENVTNHNVDSVGCFMMDSVKYPQGYWVVSCLKENYLGVERDMIKYIGTMLPGQKETIQLWALKTDSTSKMYVSLFWKR
jgi:hypothetical protein